MNLTHLAFIVFHSLVPAGCIGLLGASPIWLLGSVLFALAVIRTAPLSPAPQLKLALCLISGISMLLSLMLGVSYYMQGTGFNTQFFYHLDQETVAIAAQAYGRVFFPALLWLLMAFFAPLVLCARGASAKTSMPTAVILWIGAAVASYPVHSLVNYGTGKSDQMSAVVPQVPAVVSASQPSSPRMELVKEPAIRSSPDIAPRKKNIVLIYAEGLEQLYFDEAIFGDLLPSLKELSGQAHKFTNVYQVPGTAWTIAGIVASQCGFPLIVGNHLASNSTMASVERPFEDQTCFADILQDSGYETVYMGGAPLAFAGKGNFLRTHGYDKVYGREELQSLLPDPDYNMGWGLHDDSLFDLAMEELRVLERGGEPYLLTLLTLGTHHPSGHVAQSCGEDVHQADEMSRAIRCSDQLIGDFIRKAMDTVNMDDTIIVLFSDHLAMRNTLWDKLQQNRAKRRLTWLIFDNKPATSSDQVATHLDVAPTLLHLAGFDDYQSLGQGSSLLARQGTGAGSKPPEIDVQGAPRSLVSSASVKESGFGISYGDLTISVGDFAARASKNGWPFRTGLFLFLFDENGQVSDTIYSDDFAKLIKVLEGRYVVGISIHGPKSLYEDQYFYGRLSPELRDFNVLSLDSDVRVEAAELSF